MLNSNPANPGSISVTLNRTTLSSANPTSVEIYNVLDSSNILATITNPTFSGTEISFTHTFAAGGYGFLLHYEAYGKAICAETLQVQASGYTAAPASASYAGGVLTVSGSNISPEATITVGGMIGKAI